MSYQNRGVRDGTGPNSGSYRRGEGASTGRRQAAGESCPVSGLGADGDDSFFSVKNVVIAAGVGLVALLFSRR